MYTLRATIKSDGKVVDVSETPFGFREWTLEWPRFQAQRHRLARLGRHAYACHQGGMARLLPQDQPAFHAILGHVLDESAAGRGLDFFDQNGVVVRRSGMLDGEAIGYMAIEEDPDLKEPGTEVKMDLMRNWRDQVVAQVKGERNHPSVMIWSIENEWLYINCINLLRRPDGSVRGGGDERLRRGARRSIRRGRT